MAGMRPGPVLPRGEGVWHALLWLWGCGRGWVVSKRPGKVGHKCRGHPRSQRWVPREGEEGEEGETTRGICPPPRPKGRGNIVYLIVCLVVWVIKDGREGGEIRAMRRPPLGEPTTAAIKTRVVHACPSMWGEGQGLVPGHAVGLREGVKHQTGRAEHSRPQAMPRHF